MDFPGMTNQVELIPIGPFISISYVANRAKSFNE